MSLGNKVVTEPRPYQKPLANLVERRGADSADKRNDLSGGVTFLPGFGELLPLLSGSVGGKNSLGRIRSPPF